MKILTQYKMELDSKVIVEMILNKEIEMNIKF